MTILRRLAVGLTLFVIALALFISMTAAEPDPYPVRVLAPPQTTFDHVVDVYEGLADSATVANNAGLTFFPGAIGPGAVMPPMYDDILNGIGEWKSFRVTNYNYGSLGDPGTMRSALDSAAAWGADRENCTMITFGGGGAVNINFFDDPDGHVYDDDFNCVLIMGQTAQGGGVNMWRGRLRARWSDHIYCGYQFSRKPGQTDNFCFDGASSMMGGSGYYAEHLDRSWWNQSSGRNGITMNCRTELVNRTGNECRDWTAAGNLIAEMFESHSTFFSMTAGGKSDDVPHAKSARALMYRNVMLIGGQRTPNHGGMDSLQMISNVADGMRNHFGWPSQNPDRRSKDIFYRDMLDQYYGDMDWTNLELNDNSGWALYWPETTQTADTVTWAYTIKGIRHPRNNFALNTPVEDYFTGGFSDRIFACDGDFTTGRTETFGPSWCNDGNEGSLVPSAQVLRTPQDTMRIATALGIPWAEPEITPIIDSVLYAIVQNAGNSRYVDCHGQWTRRGANGFFGDTASARFKMHFLTGVGPSNFGGWQDWSAELNTGVTRTYGQPEAGAPCPDVDDDDLPDDWEYDHYGDLTSVTATTKVLGVWPALMMYSFGRNPGGGLIGCNGTCSAEGGGTVIPPTYNSRYVYFVPVDTTQSFFGFRSFPEFTPLSDIAYSAYHPSADSVLVVSCSPNPTLQTPADSTTTDARLASWSLPSFPDFNSLITYDPPYTIEC